MAAEPRQRPAMTVGDTLRALARAEGSRAQPHVAAIADAPVHAMARELSDAIHYLCTLHGRHPGVIDYAATHSGGLAGGWLAAAAAGFAEERAYLTRLVVLAGPQPSTPGQADSAQTVVAQGHALAMLAQSDRSGTALGAALALVLDWSAVRRVLDAGAIRLGAAVPPLALPDEAATCAAAEAAVAGAPAVERAMHFGAQQLLVQHRGLWDLLDARRIARAD